MVLAFYPRARCYLHVRCVTTLRGQPDGGARKRVGTAHCCAESEAGRRWTSLLITICQLRSGSDSRTHKYVVPFDSALGTCRETYV
jgi:hypothetical protein